MDEESEIEEKGETIRVCNENKEKKTNKRERERESAKAAKRTQTPNNESVLRWQSKPFKGKFAYKITVH